MVIKLLISTLISNHDESTRKQGFWLGKLSSPNEMLDYMVLLQSYTLNRNCFTKFPFFFTNDKLDNIQHLLNLEADIVINEMKEFKLIFVENWGSLQCVTWLPLDQCLVCQTECLSMVDFSLIILEFKVLFSLIMSLEIFNLYSMLGLSYLSVLQSYRVVFL